MKSSNKSSFIRIFLLAFFGSLAFLVALQYIILGKIHWYNASEEMFERLHVSHNSAQSASYIRVTIAPKNSSPTIPGVTYFTSTDEDSFSNEEAMEFVSPVEISATPRGALIPNGYESTIDRVVSGTYFQDTLWDFHLYVDTVRTSPRGQVANESVTLSTTMGSLPEVGKVLTHELGHMIDIYLLKTRGFSSDPSYDFYDISWSEPKVLKAGVKNSAFVSGYAATNQYEDFAESFAMYVFHNKVFEQKAVKNKYLQEKYDFLRDQVFGVYFLGNAYERDPIKGSIWDVTKIVLKKGALDSVFNVKN